MNHSLRPEEDFEPNGIFHPREHTVPNFRWWIYGFEVDQEVMQADIQRYLGPNAVSRPARTPEVGYYLWSASTTLILPGRGCISYISPSYLYRSMSDRIVGHISFELISLKEQLKDLLDDSRSWAAEKAKQICNPRDHRAALTYAQWKKHQNRLTFGHKQTRTGPRQSTPTATANASNPLSQHVRPSRQSDRRDSARLRDNRGRSALLASKEDTYTNTRRVSQNSAALQTYTSVPDLRYVYTRDSTSSFDEKSFLDPRMSYSKKQGHDLMLRLRA